MAMTSWSKHSPCVRQGSVCHQQHPVSDLKAARQEGGGGGSRREKRKQEGRQKSGWELRHCNAVMLLPHLTPMLANCRPMKREPLFAKYVGVHLVHWVTDAECASLPSPLIICGGSRGPALNQSYLPHTLSESNTRAPNSSRFKYALDSSML